MKILLMIGILMVTEWSLGQVWRDSVQSARKAYFSKKYDQAEHTYSFVEKTINGKIDLSAEKGQNAYRKGNYNSAVKYYKRSLKKVKNTRKNVLSHYNLGNSYFKQKRYKEAIQSYKYALKIDPLSQEARYNLSQALRKQKHPKNEQKPKDPNNKNPDQKNKQENKKDPTKGNDRPNKDSSDKTIRKKQQKNATDRLLDKLQKDEVATKRKLNNARIKRNGTPKTSEYNW